VGRTIVSQGLTGMKVEKIGSFPLFTSTKHHTATKQKKTQKRKQPNHLRFVFHFRKEGFRVLQNFKVFGSFEFRVKH